MPPRPDEDVDKVDKEVLAAAQELVASRSRRHQRHPRPSALGERRSPTSDLDLVVIDEDSAESRWEGVHGGRWPVEMFISDLKGWERCVAKEVHERRPLVMQITATGVPLTTDTTRRQRCSALLDGSSPKAPVQSPRRSWTSTATAYGPCR